MLLASRVSQLIQPVIYVLDLMCRERNIESDLGFSYKYYDRAWNTLPDFNQIVPVKTIPETQRIVNDIIHLLAEVKDQTCTVNYGKLILFVPIKSQFVPFEMILTLMDISSVVISGAPCRYKIPGDKATEALPAFCMSITRPTKLPTAGNVMVAAAPR